MAFLDSEVHNDKPCTISCLKNYETLKKQYDDLVARNHETKFKAITYKRRLDTVEAQLVTYRKNEVLFSEEVVVLKREVGIKQYEINTLKTKFEKVKQEKDAIDLKIPNRYGYAVSITEDWNLVEVKAIGPYPSYTKVQYYRFPGDNVKFLLNLLEELLGWLSLESVIASLTFFSSTVLSVKAYLPSLTITDLHCHWASDVFEVLVSSQWAVLGSR
ncbi:hypothetical protein Tco_0749664 [Tanacetum coccineum]|uniref:Uncharacterized protein n=1 Tax=Tanacetum coccineum TaxID=301880 RepID=A0ABQ4Z2L9_9ASTR